VRAGIQPGMPSNRIITPQTILLLLCAGEGLVLAYIPDALDLLFDCGLEFKKALQQISLLCIY